MNFLQLKYFLFAAREGSLSKAAQKLFVTQPALSFQIKNLEEEIGKPLFVRTGRMLRLPETGVFLYRRAEAILALLEKTESELCAM